MQHKADLGKWCPEDIGEVQDGAGLEVATQSHHPVVCLQAGRHLSVREALPTHALGLLTQLSLGSPARTDLASSGGPGSVV